jgi:hypothetical protein
VAGIKYCVECGERIGIRATRCGPCKRIHKTKAMRGYRAQDELVTNAVDHLGLPVVQVAPGEVVGDGKTVPGQAHQFESPYAPKPAEPTLTEALDPRVESPATRQARRTMSERSRIPNWVRRDRVAYAREVAAQNRPHGGCDLAPGGIPWGDLAAAQDHFGMEGEPNEPFVHDALFTNTWSPAHTRAADATMIDGGRRGGHGYTRDAWGRSVPR